MSRVMPPAEYRKLLAQAQKVGFDARELDYAVVGVRFAEPAPANGLPEFVVVVRGDGDRAGNEGAISGRVIGWR